MKAWSIITSAFPKCLTVFLFIYTGSVTVLDVRVLPISLTIAMAGLCMSLSLYTYFKVIRTGAGSPLDFPELRIDNVDAADEGVELPPPFLSKRSVTLKRNGRFRFCRVCAVWKPDRCHHCSACKKCFLKMDHHCPWFASCVGYANQKYFVQFLIYGTVFSILIFLLSGTELLLWFKNQRYNQEMIQLPLLVVWILSVAISISMLAFTSYTVYLITKNQTTIEMYEWSNLKAEANIMDEVRGTNTFEDKNVFDLGSASLNWKYVMGETWLEWLLPIPTFSQVRSRHTLDESGLYFKINQDFQEQIFDSIDLQERLMRRLTPRSSFEQSNVATNNQYRSSPIPS
ncbi:palmitoyltransferase PFA3 [Lachancea thermotolerans CBS 6340]|uniref:Palmitoyltransferase n=1 Tax=Lachancea thermotolerans (strain ATCC 56472 / CBS 6340 / NRRL Y-8284) TaxID=559295 RepID=C5DJW2_LACTC|nr:KLTH0F19580p [Lachancea thermotolerans CBS 6340]CAR24601.1 KLTH0F19580p [Lachancea thermotolerans CBS 6340]